MRAGLAAAGEELVGGVGACENGLVVVGKVQVVQREGRDPELVRRRERGREEAGQVRLACEFGTKQAATSPTLVARASDRGERQAGR